MFRKPVGGFFCSCKTLRVAPGLHLCLWSCLQTMGLSKPRRAAEEPALGALCQCNLEPPSSSPHPYSSLYQEMARLLFLSVIHPHAPSPARVPFIGCFQVSQPRPLLIFCCCHLQLSAQCLECSPRHCYLSKYHLSQLGKNSAYKD